LIYLEVTLFTLLEVELMAILLDCAELSSQN